MTAAAATAAVSIITLLQNQFIGGVNKLKVQKSAHIQMEWNHFERHARGIFSHPSDGT